MGYLSTTRYWADTVNIGPGERYSVLLELSDPGVWVWHCHILTDVERDVRMFANGDRLDRRGGVRICP